MVGASPLISGLFHDEPTIEALNKLDLDVTARRQPRVRRGRRGAAASAERRLPPERRLLREGKKFKGADFPYLAANVIDEKTGKPILKPYSVWKKNGVKIGFIGVTLEGTPNIVTAEGVKGLKFHDEVETINKYAKELEQQGVKSIVALIHEGGLPARARVQLRLRQRRARGDGISGPIVDIAKNISPEGRRAGHRPHPPGVRLHDPGPGGQAAHWSPRPPRSAASTRTSTLTLRPPHRRHRPYGGQGSANHVVSRDVAKAAGHDRADRPLEHAGRADRQPPASATSPPTSRAAAPRHRVAARRPDRRRAARVRQGARPQGRRELALMNPGGIRADLVYAASGSEGDGVVTYGEAFTVQPFTNMVNLSDLTGAQLITALQQQVSGAQRGLAEDPPGLQGPHLHPRPDEDRRGPRRRGLGQAERRGRSTRPPTYRVAMNSSSRAAATASPTLGKGTNDLVGADDLAALSGLPDGQLLGHDAAQRRRRRTGSRS